MTRPEDVISQGGIVARWGISRHRVRVAAAKGLITVASDYPSPDARFCWYKLADVEQWVRSLAKAAHDGHPPGALTSGGAARSR